MNKSWIVIPPGYDFAGYKFNISGIVVDEETSQLSYDLELEDDSISYDEITPTINKILMERLLEVVEKND